MARGTGWPARGNVLTFRSWCVRLHVAALCGMAAIAGLVLFYAYPTGDDLCHAVRVSRTGIAASIAFDYTVMFGRWFASSIEFTLTALPGFASRYGLWLGLIFGAYTGATIALVRTVLPDDVPVGGRRLLPLSLMALYWSGLSSVNDTVYWFPGAVEYELGVALFMLVMAALLALSRWRDRTTVLEVVGIIILVIAATGMHELLGLLLTIMLSVGAAIALRLHHKQRFLWCTATAAAIVGFAVVYIAPGNDARVARTQTHGEWLRAAGIAAEQALRTFPDWIFDTRLLLATTLVLIHPAFWAAVGRATWLDDRRVPWRLLVTGLWLLFMSALLLGPAWGTGRWVPSRVLAPLYMVFLFGWFTTIFVWARKRASTGVALAESRAWFALLVFFSASLLLTGNTSRVINDLAGRLPVWQQALEARKQEIVSASGRNTDLRLRLTAERPFSVGFLELTGNPDDWINVCAAEYHGLKSVAYEF